MMIQLKTRCMEVAGTNYEIGYGIGRKLKYEAALKSIMAAAKPVLLPADAQLAAALFDRWCPGLNEELKGCADALEVDPLQMIFYSMTYLVPRCSQVALPPEMTDNCHVLLAQNYEFNHRMEDFTLFRTCVKGKYAHIGTSVIQFGREEGLNEMGLGITMSSCGFPVGAQKMMRPPALRGLQFWAVIRTLLENCADVNEALKMLKEMPIAYNLNLILADPTGHIALFETLNGKFEVKCLEPGCGRQFLHAANHPHLPGIQKLEPKAMHHSVIRYEWIEQFIKGRDQISSQDLEELLMAKYPEGLCCNFYDDFFGTTKSVIIDVTDKTFRICWGGRKENGWRIYPVDQTMESAVYPIGIVNEPADSSLNELVDLKLEL